jgi:hypothetical protein
LRYLTPPERIANRVVADEYAAVSAKIDALYGQQPELPADYQTTSMASPPSSPTTTTAHCSSSGLITAIGNRLAASLKSARPSKTASAARCARKLALISNLGS